MALYMHIEAIIFVQIGLESSHSTLKSWGCFLDGPNLNQIVDKESRVYTYLHSSLSQNGRAKFFCLKEKILGIALSGEKGWLDYFINMRYVPFMSPLSQTEWKSGMSHMWLYLDKDEKEMGIKTLWNYWNVWSFEKVLYIAQVYHIDYLTANHCQND